MVADLCMPRTHTPFLIYSHAKTCLELQEVFKNHSLHEMQPPYIWKRTKTHKQKINHGNKNFLHNPQKFSALVDGHSCLTSSMTWLIFQPSQHPALLPFWPLNILMHSPLATTSSHEVLHKPFSYYTNSFITLRITPSILSTVKTSLKQCDICDYHHLMWHYEHKNTFTGSLTVVIHITCIRCVAHTHFDTFTAHHYSS